MKNPVIFRLGALLIFLGLASVAQAQTRPVAPGYWNVETNRTTRDYTIVRFYNGQDQLVYEETLPNVCLDLSRRPGRSRRTQAQLTIALEQVLRDPQVARRPDMLAAQLGADRHLPRVYAVR